MTQRNVLPIASSVRRIQLAHRTATPRDVPGSRPLATHRAAMLQSGSPPGVRSAQPAACLWPFCVPSSSISAVAFSELLVVVLVLDAGRLIRYYSPKCPKVKTCRSTSPSLSSYRLRISKPG